MRTVTLRGADAPVVSVNGAVIANAAIAREVQNHAGASPRQAWESATRALVVRELLLQTRRVAGTRGRAAQPGRAAGNRRGGADPCAARGGGAHAQGR